jgi:hypothetical protein
MGAKSRSVGAPRKQIDIFDVVVLTEDVPPLGLHAGDKAQVCWVWPDKQLEVELPRQFNDVGVFGTVLAAQVRRAAKADYPKPKHYSECECGSTTGYCDWADRDYCPRCDVWLDRVCGCDPRECQYAERARPQRRPSYCPNCAKLVEQQRAAYEAEPTAERSGGVIWCTED